MVNTAEKRKKQSKSKSNLKNTSVVNKNFIEGFRIVLLCLISIIVFYPPFLRGLYFEDEQLPTEIFVFLIYIAFMVYKYLIKNKKLIKTPLEYVSLGFTAVYLVSIFTAVGTREAVGEWLKYCMFFAIFTMLSELLNTYKSKIAVLWVIISSALGVSLIGIDGMAGNKLSGALNKVIRVFDPTRDIGYGTFVGNRINSTFQYPNATAAYLMAVFFVAAALILLSKKIHLRLLAALSSYIILITFMLTLSRGAMVFIPFAGVLFVLMQPRGYKFKSIFSMIPAGIGMLLTVSKLTNYMAAPDGNAANIWKYLALGILVTLVAQLIIEILSKALSKYDGKKLEKLGYALCGIAAVFIIIGAVLAINTKAPLVMGHGEGQADSNISVRRSFTLQPDKEYKLIYSVQAQNTKDKPNSYSVNIASRDFAGIINEVDSPIINTEGKPTVGVEQKEIQFKVPSNSRAVSITFLNLYEGTSVEFKDAKLVPVGHSDKERSITLKYKYIPESLYARVDEAKETKSGIERTIFARDGFDIFKEHILIGGGGGSWPLQYFAHQSYLYWTTQAHNYPVQVAVETGVLGLIILSALWLSVGAQIVRTIINRKVNDADAIIINAGALAGVMAIIMHSVMDFDLSLSSIFLLLWELLAIVNANVPADEAKPEFCKLYKIFDKLLYEVKSISLHPGIVIVISAVIVAFPIMFLGGNTNNIMAARMQNEKNSTKAIEYMDKAIASDFISPKYKADYINLVISKDPNAITKSDIVKSNKYAESIEKAAENNVDVATKLGTYYTFVANFEKAKHFLERSIELRPLSPVQWENKANAYYQIAMFSKSNGDNKTADKYFNYILQISAEAKKASQKSMIPFILSPTAMETIEKVSLLQDKSNSSNESISAKSIFYNINDIDIDNNGVPDEWNDTNLNDVKVQLNGKNLIAEIQNGKQGILQSRKINLKQGKTYIISVDLENAKDITGDVLVTISGQKDPIKLTRSSTFMAEINTATGGNIEPVSFGLVVNGRYVVKDFRVVEK